MKATDSEVQDDKALRHVELVGDGTGNLAGVVREADREEVSPYGQDEKSDVFWRVEGR